ncbi:hypothetical protein Ahy_B04g072727 isoform C [Arachis hypogaea]|uniref:Uncharacterized protein n=1 Tax=Arachis hypogaea TaxID=3818 RepID=A0A444ZNK9_ARAHY|nr:hypothetical protein Ahy_B04g072727 isoform C [Arachis hypogaea]
MIWLRYEDLSPLISLPSFISAPSQATPHGIVEELIGFGARVHACARNEAELTKFPCLYFQTLSHICFSLSQKCNQRNREMKQRGRKHSMYMGLVVCCWTMYA